MEQKPTANGVDRCRNCGSSDISFDGSWLVCGYCHTRWNTPVLADELHLSEGIENLVGTTVLTGARGIDTSSLVTVVCDGCGAAVTINTETTLSATCHWCRHTLSLNHPVDNGAIPDAILPFYVSREEAAASMADYVYRQCTFASPEFTRDFENASPKAAYLPYLVVDGKVTVRLEGRAWIPDRRSPDWNGGITATGAALTSTTDSNQQYISEEFAVMREADLLVDDLAIEARSTRSRLYAAVSTTNIINAIQPFDVENAVRFDANYLTEGITLERRDVEVADAMGDSAGLFATIARGYVNQTLTRYKGGVRWEQEIVAIQGTRWVSVLLPVWLYAFEEATPTGPMMHYIAVNGRTGEVEGSVPIDQARVRAAGLRWGWFTGGLLGGAPTAIAATAIGISVLDGTVSADVVVLITLAAGACIAGGIGLGRSVARWRRGTIARHQRNAAARLMPEVETRYTPTRFEQDDRSLGTFKHFGGPEIEGRNDHRPALRAEDSRFVLGELPERTSDDRAAASDAPNPQHGLRFDERGRVRAGQPPTAFPPGTAVGRSIQLIPGWRGP